MYACVVNNHRLFCEVSTLNSYFLNLIVVLASKDTVFILGIAQHIKENLCCYCTISPYDDDVMMLMLCSIKDVISLSLQAKL